MGTHNGLAPLHIDGGTHHIVHLQRALHHGAGVEVLAALVLLHVGDLEAAVSQENHALVSHLAAHLRIEGGLIQHQDAILAAGDGASHFIPHTNCQNLGIGGIGIVAHKGGGGVVQTQVNAGPGQIAQGLPGFSCPHLLLLHELGKGLLVHFHALVCHHFHSQVDGEAVGIIELESIGAGEHGLALFLVGGQHLSENPHTAVNGTGEVLFLVAHHPDDVLCPLPQVGVVILVLPDHRLHHFKQERLVHTQELAVTGSPTEQPPQHIASALIGGLDTVGNHEGCCPDMVGDNPEGHIGLMALAIGSAGDGGDMVGDVHNSIHIEQAVHILAHHGQTLQAHAGIDVLLHQLGVVAVAVVVKLGEHVVPHFHVPVAVTAYGAVGLAAAVLLAPVIVNLAAGTAGAGAVLPEVVRLAKPENPLRRDADFLVPDFKGFLIVFIDGGVQPVLFQAHHLGQKFPAPGNGLVLEVIAEGEVAQHLEVGAVTGGLADVVNVAGTDTLLAGADSSSGGLHLALEVGLHGSHTGIDEKQGLVILGNEGKTGQAQVLLGLKEGKEHLTQLVYTIGFFAHWISTST